ncbi:flagellar motor switch protein FliN [Novosphingobium sp. FSY-8]|uniref:Flagellar motor switch protein FliN n=1 Tax=Novosphingobium ovatum TaxID=1908523 RepID=A0ABW9XGH2_9SPHN|nr:flagellar motor switch protein FliN [Novosphingobium ovatum]NBC37517.1 flagellar motor switch protein FliN [Novosphingobium ovatum]
MSFTGFPTRGFDFLKDVDVRLSVELGRTEMKLKDVLSLGEESIVMLDRLTDELLDVMVNGKIIAKGEIVTQGNRFGLRIVEMAGAENDPDEGRAAADVGAMDLGDID